MRLTLRKKEIISKQSEFQRIRFKGKRSRGRYLTLNYSRLNKKSIDLKGKSFASTKSGVAGSLLRVGVSISCRVSKKSTERNKLRRIAREFVRKRKNELSYPCEIVITFQAGAARASASEIRKDLEITFRRAGLIE